MVLDVLDFQWISFNLVFSGSTSWELAYHIFSFSKGRIWTRSLEGYGRAAVLVIKKDSNDCQVKFRNPPWLQLDSGYP